MSPRSDYERDEVGSAAMHRMFEAKRRRQSDPPAPVLSDYEKDDRESELQIEAFADLAKKYQARQQNPAPSPTPTKTLPPKN